MRKISTILVVLLILSSIVPQGVLASHIGEDVNESISSEESHENDHIIQDEEVREELDDDEESLNEEENIEHTKDPELDKDEQHDQELNEETQEEQQTSNEENHSDHEVEKSENDEDVINHQDEEKVDEEDQNQVIMSVSTNSVGNPTSRLGHIRSSNVNIYKNLNNLSSSFKAGSKYTNTVYYIKRQANIKGKTYYLISTSPSSSKGVLGWVKATNLSTHPHVGVDKTSKTFHIKGTGKSYNTAWGGSKNLVYSLSEYKGHIFKVNLTEKVGNNTWYRGTLAGETVWIHSSYLIKSAGVSTSKLGHIRNGNVKIYASLDDKASFINAGSKYTNSVYYIKRQANIKGKTYYLISTSPSSSKGVVGWVNAKDLSTHSHGGTDKKPRTLYFKGTGKAYSKAWGGSKDMVHNSMSQYKSQEFKVNLTEKVGDNTWYRGVLNGETIWLHSSYVTTKTESKISRLGHLRANVKVYKNIGDESSTIDGNKYTNSVYYIKKRAKVNNETYYLISSSPSSTKGVIGWVKSKDLSTHPHVGVDKKTKAFYIKGTGTAYSKAWGGTKDTVYSSLAKYEGDSFKVNLTEKVGNNTWYRGTLGGKKAWIHSSYLNETSTNYTQYDLTFKEALDIQMTRSPQTDKYRNSKAYISSSYVNITRTGAITGSGVRLRTAPNFGNNISETVNNGTKVEILGEVTGDKHGGSTKWYKVKYKNRTLYVHTSLANPNAKVATTTANVNVRDSQSATGHIFGTIPKGTSVNVIKEGNTWHEISYGTWRNPKRSDVEAYMNPDKNDPFQHLLLTSSVGVSAKELNKVLKGKGILDGMGAAFIEGAKQHSVNEIYLISHALLESGNGTSKLAKGVKVNGKTVYNMFGIGAYDSCPLECGAQHAYDEGWDTPHKAIVGGAKFIGKDYIHNKYKQNTIYKMRWNHLYAPKQYATDIGWAVKQTNLIKSMYGELTNPNLHYDIPRFK